jgi:hypothetical protein
MAPADPPAGGAAPDEETPETPEDPPAGDEGGGDDETQPPEEKKSEKGKEKAPEKKAAEKKGAKEAKSADEKKSAKKTLLGAKDVPTDAEKAPKGEKSKAGDDQGAGESDLDTWQPKLADGVKVDEELLGEAKKIAKEHGLKGQQLQGFVELGVRMQEKAAQEFVDAHEAAVEKLASAAKADKEIGGAKLEESLQSGLSVLKKYAGAEFPVVIAELERTGLGSHPALIKTLVRIDKATRDDDTTARVRGGKAGAKDADPMAKFTKGMYPRMAKELARERGEDVDDDG